jgi:hypothetical protein
LSGKEEEGGGAERLRLEFRVLVWEGEGRGAEWGEKVDG